MIDSTSVVCKTYGFSTSDVAWQYDCFWPDKGSSCAPTLIDSAGIDRSRTLPPTTTPVNTRRMTADDTQPLED
jgi:hypothetical protein